MNTISSSGSANFQFSGPAITTAGNAFSFGNSGVAFTSSTGGTMPSFGTQTSHRYVAKAVSHRSIKRSAKSAPPMLPASTASSGTAMSAALKSFEGFTFNTISFSGISTTAMTTTTSSMLTFADNKSESTTAAAPMECPFGLLQQAPSAATDASAIVTSSTTATLQATSTSLPSMASCVKTIWSKDFDTFTFTAPSVAPLRVPAATTELAKPENSEADSNHDSGPSQESSADLTVSTATTQSVDGPISSPFQNEDSTEGQPEKEEKPDEQEQEKEKVLIDQKLNDSDSIVPTVEDRVHKSPDPTEHSQIVAKLKDINFSLRILICICLFAVVAHVFSLFNYQF